jgi:hypothetical protein
MAIAMSLPGKKKFQRWRRSARASAISLMLFSPLLLPGCAPFMAGAYATSAVQLWMNRDKYFGAPPPNTAKMQDPRPQRRRHTSSRQAANPHKPGHHFTAKKQERKAAAPEAIAKHNGAALPAS